MKICVVGHTGFVGRVVYRHFCDFGHEVCGINSSTKEMPTGKFELVVNAAGSSVKYMARENPGLDFEQSVGVFSTIVKLKSDNFIQISSIDAGGDTASNYTKSKLVAEYCARMYFPNVTVLRLGGLVGPGLRKNVVYDIINNKDLHVSFDSAFNYISTKEVGKVIDSIVGKSFWGETIYVAASQGIRVSEIIDICRQNGREFSGKEGEGRQDYSSVDIGGLRKVFEPRTSREYILDFLSNDL